MNILYLAHRIPFPPNKGDKLRAFREIEHLSRRHRVWCACFVDDERDWPHGEALRRYCADVATVPLRPTWSKVRGLMGLLKGGTVTESYYESRAMNDVLDRWCREVAFDAVVAFSSGMAPYALRVQSPRRVLDMCDRDSLKWSDYAAQSRGFARLLYRIEAERLEAKESEWATQFDATVLITEAESAGLTGVGARNTNGRRIHIVGNGVVMDDRLQSSSTPDHRLAAETKRVGFVGVMDYKPNVDGVCWFAKHSWPTIKRLHPTATFRIIGRSPVRSVRRLAQMEGIEVVGEVADVSAELAKIDVSVAPLLIARGLQNKVLEAMAAGKPVVLTRRVAMGLKGRDQEHFVIGDSAADVANAVILLMNDAEKARRIGEAARAFVKEQYRWDVELEKFERIVTGASESSAELWMNTGQTSLQPTEPLVCTM